MKYSAHLQSEILAELEKVPIIRQVCAKVGIDHSTFYRWQFSHPEFRKKVALAQALGRHRVTDAAESVIITGIQNKEHRSATFWLTHNEPRYMSLHKDRQNQEFLQRKFDSLFKETPDDYTPTFEKLFEIYWSLEQERYEPELIERIMRPMVELLCIDDPKIVDVFFPAYEDWKREKTGLERKLNALDPDGEVRRKLDER